MGSLPLGLRLSLGSVPQSQSPEPGPRDRAAAAKARDKAKEGRGWRISEASTLVVSDRPPRLTHASHTATNLPKEGRRGGGLREPISWLG